MSTDVAFSLTGPLPGGLVAIEASAGTGKTFALTGLVLRYVAEAGVPIDQILVVTFTRAAAAELRDRIRTRLAEAATALRAGASPGAASPPAIGDDEVLAAVASGDRDRRLRRIEQALADIDAATITTIHSFAQQVLATLGSSAPGDLDATLADDARTLIASVCADVIATQAVLDPDGVDELPTADTLAATVATALGNPDVRLVPEPDDPDAPPAAARLRRLVDLSVEQVRRRRRLAGTLSFDDVLNGLAEALRTSDAAVEALRRRFRLALVDEFQDTDPVQWEIFQRLFASAGPGTALVLVADPKQAIYGFRGADVHTYLHARSTPGITVHSLSTNWRSDGALLDALGRLLTGATFGGPAIGFAAVGPAPGNEDRRLVTARGEPLPALALRAAVGDGLALTSGGTVTTPAAERAIAADLADHVRRLLDVATLPGATGGATRPLEPADVAVLVARHAEGRDMQRALRTRGIPAVIARGDSVLDSEAAEHWRWLLGALDRPADPARARTAARSCFFGLSLADVAGASDADVGEMQDRLDRWAGVLASRGVVELCAHLWAETGVTARALADNDGDRLLTDLEHIASLLRTAPASRPTPAGLLALLDDLRTGPAADPEQDVTARRVESEARAVQIMTVHASKGLEFPVVCVPTMWRPSLAKARQVLFHDSDDDRRTFDVTGGMPWPTAGEARSRKERAAADALGENLRLLYVALTRARHHTAVWWAPVKDSDTTGLARVLFARDAGRIDPARFDARRVTLPGDDETVAGLRASLGTSDGTVSVHAVGHREPGSGSDPWHDPAAALPAADLAVALLERTPDRTARRLSFTAITEHHTGESGDTDGPTRTDADDDTLGDAGARDERPERPAVTGMLAAAEPVPPATTGDAVSPPLGAVPGGTGFGDLVHQILERVDFAAPDLRRAIGVAVDDCLRWHPWPVDPALLADGLHAAACTPTGAALGGGPLAGLAIADCRRELRFDLPLGDATRRSTDRDLGTLVRSHLPDGHPLRPWAQGLATGSFGVNLAGHLTGSIDLVVRVAGPAATSAPRYAVVDYKTNRLGDPQRPATLADYHPDRLAGAMTDHDYPLQALLYAVALHRYLRWRLPGYDPAEHLAGAAYLFVRGMAGPAAVLPDGRPFGVFTWDLGPDLVSDASDMLAGRSPTRIPRPSAAIDDGAASPDAAATTPTGRQP